jgi:hypothetical protein
MITNKKPEKKIMTFKTYSDLNETANKDRSMDGNITYFDPSKREPWVMILR